MQWSRVWRHLSFAPRTSARLFPPAELEGLTRGIAASELHHRGEIRLVIEGSYSLSQLWAGLQPRERAIDLFGRYRVWDTEENTGVLIYLLLADHRIEIVADRGINARVPQHQWDEICEAMRRSFQAGDYVTGVGIGMGSITTLLAEHFPARAGENPNELPDAPIIL